MVEPGNAPNTGHPGEAGSDAASKTCIAQLLKGFELILGDGSARALHQASEAFYHAILSDEIRPESYVGLGLCCLNLGDAGRALRYFDLALVHGFGSGAYASLTYECDDPHGQTQSFDIDLDAVLGWRAACHLALHAPAAAARELARVSNDPALELRPGLAVLQGRIRLADGDLAGAQRCLGEALAWDPEEPDAHFLRGQLHAQRGDLPAALRAYSRAINIDPGEVDFRIARAGVLITLGNHERAREDLAAAREQLAEQFPQPEKEALLATLCHKVAMG